MASPEDEVGKEGLPPPPPVIPPHVVPIKAEPSPRPEHLKRSPMVRCGFGSGGRHIQLLSNHFSVRFTAQDAAFYHYTVTIKSEDKHAVEAKGMGRKIMDKLYQTYSSELAGKEFAYDGEKSLFTVGPLPQNNFEFTVVLEESSLRRVGGLSPGNASPSEGDRKRSKHSRLAKKFNIEISYAAKIPLNSIALALKGSESEHTQDALRVLDIILRQQQAKRGCLLVRQSFFNGEHTNFCDLGGGVAGCRGFHSSFRTTLGGLSLNMDVSTTMIMKPGPVVDFLLANQGVKDPRQVDWVKAKRMLKNMRIKTRHNNLEFKIIGISEMPCNQQHFPMKVRDGNGEGQIVEVTVYDYFVNSRKIELTWSANMPCLDVGKPKRPNYLPVELCHLVSLQRYTKALSGQQRAALVEKSRQKPQERIRVVTDAVQTNRYEEDVLLSSCGIHIERKLTQLDGRVLPAPTLKVGNAEDCVPRNGRWNFNSKRLWEPIKIERWAIVNFSARCDMSHLSRELINCGKNKGILINRPFTLIEEDRQWIRSGPMVRVERMIEQIKARLPGPPEFLLCVLPERKNSDIYGPWKRKNLHELGIVTQCIAPNRINDQYLTNVLLKINSKLGGTNSILAVEHRNCIPLINENPTMILGMDVSHGSPGRSDIPSIAAVVGSRYWPLISRYRASVRTQSPKLEMIDSLYKPQANGQDDGILRELLVDFYQTSGCRKPSQIIIFRDGVSESQFSQVLNIELDQIIKVYEHLGEATLPKFTVIVAQKNHHTKLFQAGGPENVPPGTVVDTKVVHPRNYDFYMCAHAGMIGTSRPTHYHILLNEIGFSADDLQELVHSLSYVYQRSTTAVSIVAPICYAHLAAAQMSQFMKFEDFSETSSGQGPVTASGQSAIPELPQLHPNVCSSMFFC
uniref:Protein argonaute 16 n=2 Tax=Elaeis guineensis var. tenera TaxID=51953 RepID=A0A6I9SI38_ELAGV|nr:protein argonaute 16 [Elaeis guineensis]XP_029116515.1 protein argonaute 16 [Elaeis guineensis]